MNASRFVYTLLLYALLPRALVHLWWRARRQPAYLEHIGERFGRYAAPARAPLIWVHAVSVGETRAAAPLITRVAAPLSGPPRTTDAHDADRPRHGPRTVWRRSGAMLSAL